MHNVALLVSKYAAALLALILGWLVNNPVKPKRSTSMLNFVSLLNVEMVIGTEETNVPNGHSGADYIRMAGSA